MKNSYESELGYYSQVEISGKDIANFARNETFFESQHVDVSGLCVLLDLYKLIDSSTKVPTRKSFLNSLRHTLKKYDVGAKDLLYAFPDSKGTIVVDGNKYKNVGKASNKFIDPDNVLNISIFCILKVCLRNRIGFLKSLEAATDSMEEYRKLLAKRRQIGDRINFLEFFSKPPSVINKTCNKLILTNGVETIAPEVCEYCRNLAAVSFPDSLKIIGNNAFWGCSHLNDIKIPGSVKIVGNRAFQNCENLNKLSLENGINKIGEYAFYGCNLQNIEVPGSVIEVGNMAFSHNKNLSDVTIKDGVQNIEKEAFNSTALKEIVLPNSIKILEGKPFDKSSTVKSIDGVVTYVPKTKEMEKIKVPEEKVQEI